MLVVAEPGSGIPFTPSGDVVSRTVIAEAPGTASHVRMIALFGLTTAWKFCGTFDPPPGGTNPLIPLSVNGAPGPGPATAETPMRP